MTLFDLRPKDSPEALFGRDEELKRLTRLVAAGRWTVVLGPRMVGKTSLIRAATKRLRRRVVYVNLWGVSGTAGFVDAFAHGISSNQSLLGKIRAQLRRIEGVSVGPTGLSIAAPRRQLKTVWELMDLIAEQEEDAVFELDEFQEVSAASGQILKLLANIFNTHTKVDFIFTGSRYGVVRALLDPKATSPLYGRSPEELHLLPFEPAQSVAFLRAGFGEYGMKPSETELEATVRRSLGGIPGWLAMYGSKVAVSRLDSKTAETQTIEEGKKVARDELKHFLEGRRSENHWPALKAIALGASWTEIRTAVSAARGSVANDALIQDMLRALVGNEIATKSEGGYVLVDPMVRQYVSATRRPP